MKVAFGAFAWSVALGLAVVVPARASDGLIERSGIERIPVESDTRVPRPRADPENADGRMHPSQPDAGRDDDRNRGAKPDTGRSPDAMEPPGCIYRQEPLGLIV
jgi:hypothetical protein